MGRTKIDISKTELEAVISGLESTGPLANRDALHKAVAETPWAKDNSVSFSVVALRIKEFGLTPKTPLGKRGRSSFGHSDGTPVVRTPRTKKGMTKERIAFLKKQAPVSLHGMIDRMARGSTTARIKFNCLYCANWDRKEVKFCQVTDCPMHDIRPYQKSLDEDDVEVVQISGGSIPQVVGS